MRQHVIIRLLSILYFVKVLTATAAASDGVGLKLETEENLVQGGLVHGQVLPGYSVSVLGHKPIVDATGKFVFGLGRDTPEEIVLVVTGRDHRTTEHKLTVKQRQYAIQKIEGVEDKYVEPPSEVLARIRSENILVAKARQTLRQENQFASGFILPASGPITGVYGSQRIFNGVPKRPHFGLDIAGPVGTKVVAPAAGKVSLAHNDMYYSGGTLIVDHGQGVSSTFIHLSKILVAQGDDVQQGQLIAEIGATGRVTGPHLDWRVNWFDQRLDPALLLPKSLNLESK